MIPRPIGRGITFLGSDRSGRRFNASSAFVERSLPAPPPRAERSLAIDAAQRCRCFDHHAENHSAVVVGQLDQTGLGDEAAKLDQLARSFTPLHRPRPRATPRPSKQ